MGQATSGSTEFFIPGIAGRPSSNSTKFLAIDSTGRLITQDLPTFAPNLFTGEENPFNSLANGTNAVAFGTDALANGVNVTAIGSGARAEGFNTNSLAIGTKAVANGTSVTALGAGAQASGVNSTAIGAGAVTRRDQQVVLGSADSEVTVANLAGTGNEMVFANADGTLKRAAGISVNNGSLSLANNLNVSGTTNLRNTNVDGNLSVTGRTEITGGAVINNGLSVSGGTSTDTLKVRTLSGDGNAIVSASSDGSLQRSASVSLEQVDQVVNRSVPELQRKTQKLESAASSLGKAVESSGAIAAALSAIPEVSLQEDEPLRCGVGTGGYGTQYAFSAGCAVRIGDRINLNGALAYTPSIDYKFGSTPSVAGRLGFSFPLGRIAKASNTSTQSSDLSEYRTQVNTNIAKLQSDVKSRDQQIDDLKTRLEQLINNPSEPSGAQSAQSQEATNELIAMLRSRIDQLEKEKREAESANAKQDQRIQELENKLAEQESMFKQVMNQLKSMIPGRSPTNLNKTSQIAR